MHIKPSCFAHSWFTRDVQNKHLPLTPFRIEQNIIDPITLFNYPNKHK